MWSMEERTQIRRCVFQIGSGETWRSESPSTQQGPACTPPPACRRKCSSGLGVQQDRLKSWVERVATKAARAGASGCTPPDSWPAQSRPGPRKRRPRRSPSARLLREENQTCDHVPQPPREVHEQDARVPWQDCGRPWENLRSLKAAARRCGSTTEPEGLTTRAKSPPKIVATKG